MIFLQLAVLLICIFIGARMSGIGLGVMGMIGLLILIFVFGMQPADPPLEVMLIILSVVTAAAALQAAGGMDYLVDVAAKILRSQPGQITFLGPVVTYFFTLFAGTAHISYSIMPIIAEVATKARIRPERAMSMSVTAAHMGITASPVSAASAALLTVLAANGVQLADILMVCIPSTLIGVVFGIVFVWKKGKDLDKDPGFIEKMKDPVFAKSIEDDQSSTSVMLRPGAAGLIILLTNTTATQVTKASLFNSAGQATIAVFGVVWMSGTFMNHNYTIIQETLGGLVTSYPWLFALALFLMSILLFSQAATTKALMPLGLSLGLAPAFLIGIFPAVNGHFFIPGYPTLITAVQFDRTGTTKIGKYVLNHSFMLPGLVTAAAAVIAGLLLQSFLL
jgi:anaerobic C4-dicarboxylate transporter DcuA